MNYYYQLLVIATFSVLFGINLLLPSFVSSLYSRILCHGYIVLCSKLYSFVLPLESEKQNYTRQVRVQSRFKGSNVNFFLFLYKMVCEINNVAFNLFEQKHIFWIYYCTHKRDKRAKARK